MFPTTKGVEKVLLIAINATPSMWRPWCFCRNSITTNIIDAAVMSFGTYQKEMLRESFNSKIDSFNDVADIVLVYFSDPT